MQNSISVGKKALQVKDNFQTCFSLLIVSWSSAINMHTPAVIEEKIYRCQHSCNANDIHYLHATPHYHQVTLILLAVPTNTHIPPDDSSYIGCTQHRCHNRQRLLQLLSCFKFAISQPAKRLNGLWSLKTTYNNVQILFYDEWDVL